MSGRGRGRPREGRPVQVRIPAEVLESVDLAAADLEVSRAEVIRRVLTDWFRAWPWIDTITRRSGLVEHVCVHEVGHPDRTSVAVLNDPSLAVHGCDGCCGTPDWETAVGVWTAGPGTVR